MKDRNYPIIRITLLIITIALGVISLTCFSYGSYLMALRGGVLGDSPEWNDLIRRIWIWQGIGLGAGVVACITGAGWWWIQNS